MKTGVSIALALFALMFVAAPAWAEEVVVMKMDNAWLTAPATKDATEFSGAEVKAVYFDGLPWQGKPTRVFAWVGLPKSDPKQPQAKVPGMVLIHGGGGTAFDRWVRIWTKRGYAAIAMDTCGQVPIGSYGNYKRDAQGGPAGWGGFDQVDQPAKDQWTYHAVADVILAHSLLRSMPQVDPDRIGVTGISWGGYLTCIVAGIDQRFKLAVPVFGCGFLGEDSAWLDAFKNMGPEKSAKWLARWDPSVYLKDVAMPTLWATGSNDPAYPLGSLRKSCQLVKGPRTLCIRLQMPHTHFAGEEAAEIGVFADSILKDGKPLAKVTAQGREESKVWATFDSAVAIKRAELNFTKDEGKWQSRRWSAAAAVLDAAGSKVTATLPARTKAFYLGLTDDRGMLVTTDPQETGDPNDPIDTADYRGTIRVACVGDSITEGFGAGRGNAWPNQIGKVLEPKWEVKNFGVSGTTLMKSGDSPYQATGKFTAAKSFNPNVVVIMLGTNDTKPQNWNKFKKDFEADYKDLVRQFAELPARPRIFVCRPPYIASDGSWGINESDTLAEIPVVDKVAVEMKLGVIDVHAALKGKDSLIPDKVHPNAQGQTLIARAVLKALTGYEGEFPPKAAVVPTSEKTPLAWRYTTEKPADDWFRPDFDASGWKEGPGGFGGGATAAGPPRTEWNTSDIWLRREFTLGQTKLNNPRLWMRHDDDAEVYLNGVLAVKAKRFNEGYADFGLRPEAAATLKPGKNVIAVHCLQTGGGQYIDAGLIDILPVTPAAQRK